MKANRRDFLGMMIGGIAGAAAVRAWPFRVYSFPSEIVVPKLTLREYISLVNACMSEELVTKYDLAVIEGWRWRTNTFTSLWHYNPSLEPLPE